MVYPVVASDGHSYERTAIQDVLGSANKKSPLTREVLTRTLVPNHALRRRIEEHETELDAPVEQVEAQVAGQAPEARAGCLCSARARRRPGTRAR